MVDVNSQNNSVSINVSSGGNSASIKATPDMAQYYSEKSREWATSNRIVDNTDYSSKYYAEKSKESETKAENYERSVIEKYNSFVDISSQAESEIADLRDNSFLELNNAKNASIADINNALNDNLEEAKANIEVSKANALGEIENKRSDAVEQIETLSEETLSDIKDLGVETRANLDLSNLSEEGEKHFLGKSNITNCLTEIPQNIKLELNNGTLTLKAGSILPWGSLEYQTTTVTEDKTYTYSGGYANVQCAIFCAKNNGTIQGPATLSDITSGSELPSSSTTGIRYYNSTNGTIYIKKSTGWVEWAVTLPIAIVTINENGVISSIDQVFNGMGYIGSTIWVDKGVKGLIPNGRNEDGTLNNIEFTIENLLTYTLLPSESIRTNNSICYNVTEGHPLLNFFTTNFGADSIASDGFIYNLIGEKRLVCELATASFNKTSISNFQPKQAFRAIDYSNKSEISSWGMPSGKYDDLTLGASGTTYTAPANGWFYLSRQSGGSGKYLAIYNQIRGNIGMTNHSSFSALQTVYTPAQKGDSVYIAYSSTGQTEHFRFIYAEGEV